MHLPRGYHPSPCVWLVLPEEATVGDSIVKVNESLRAEDWYPPVLEDVVWFGDDGTGNLFGWRPEQGIAVLWNPEDGEEPMKTGPVNTLWQYVLNGYKDTPRG